MPEITFHRLATEDIFSLLGIQDISDSEKQNIIDQITKTVLARVYADIYVSLDPNERQELDAQSPETMVSYLTNKGFPLEEMILKEGVQYRIELAAAMEAAQRGATHIYEPV